MIFGRPFPYGRPCTIRGFGRTILPERQRKSNQQFVTSELTARGRELLRADLSKESPVTEAELPDRADAKFRAVTGIETRYIFPGPLAELAEIAALDALARSHRAPEEIDAIIVGTNTADEYNIATDLKARHGVPTDAYGITMQAACPVGGMIVFEGWQMVRLGQAECVVVVGAEKAQTLASRGRYKSRNLFGSAAFAIILEPAQTETFTFFAYGSDPTNENLSLIRKSRFGFDQRSDPKKSAHQFAGRQLVSEVDRIIRTLHIDPSEFDHLFCHQASVRTNDFFLRRLREQWPSFRAEYHQNIVQMGNTSAASTGWLMARAMADGQLRSGQHCLVVTFGAGMSWMVYGFLVP